MESVAIQRAQNGSRKCQHCGKEFKNSHALGGHKKAHPKELEEEKRARIEDKEAKRARIEAMRARIRTSRSADIDAANATQSAQNRSRKCQHCGKEFKNSQALGGHKKAHRKELEEAKRARIEPKRARIQASRSADIDAANATAKYAVNGNTVAGSALLTPSTAAMLGPVGVQDLDPNISHGLGLGGPPQPQPQPQPQPPPPVRIFGVEIPSQFPSTTGMPSHQH